MGLSVIVDLHNKLSRLNKIWKLQSLNRGNLNFFYRFVSLIFNLFPPPALRALLTSFLIIASVLSV